MSNHDFNSAARSLALPLDHDNTLSHTSRINSQPWHRRTLSAPNQRPRTTLDKYRQTASKYQRLATQTWFNFTPLQRAGLVLLSLVLFVLSILFLFYNERIFAWLSPAAKRWRDTPRGWLILWAMTFFVSFPPLIGYSSCVTIAGFVYGMKGWFIVATATVVGSTCSFLVSRTVLKNFVGRITEKDKRFAALSLVLKHDGLKLLVMIRLCPLPYSLSNGAISTIPTVTWANFALATAMASPKLLLHVFVGSRIGDLAENGDKMDAKTRTVSYVSIAIGLVAGIATGYFVYIRTRARAQQLEAEEGAADVRSPSARRRSSSGNAEFRDDTDHRSGTRDRDDISLHRAYEDEEAGAVYRDDFTDDEEALEQDVFDVGDGGDEYDYDSRKNDQ